MDLELIRSLQAADYPTLRAAEVFARESVGIARRCYEAARNESRKAKLLDAMRDFNTITEELTRRETLLLRLLPIEYVLQCAGVDFGTSGGETYILS